MTPDDEARLFLLNELFDAQARRWSLGSLRELCDASPGPFVLDAALTERWAADPEAGARWARAADATRWARRVVRWLQDRQQFLAIETGAVTGMVTLALARAAAGEPAAAVRIFKDELAAVVRAQLGPRPVEVVCGAYAPGLQLRVLGLAAEGLRGPVLDVGCGEAGALVESLRGHGVTAEGIDRLRGDDWLTFDYGVDRWGAVLSHHGLSLHFLHHHLRAGPTALAYARTYMAITRSLQVGGVFAYAPGLPFIEGMLPGQLRCVRVPLPAELDTPAMQALRDETGLAIDHATQVWRRA
jgi:hypothetical protein